MFLFFSPGAAFSFACLSLLVDVMMVTVSDFIDYILSNKKGERIAPESSLLLSEKENVFHQETKYLFQKYPSGLPLWAKPSCKGAFLLL
jgi:hypothetical protein